MYAGPPGSGGFIQFPGGNFTADPSSAVALPSPGLAQQTGYGYPGGMAYDRAFSRWLPVQPTSVSPDGSYYAFAGPDGVYVVDVVTSTQTEQGSGHAWTIAGVEAQGVYASIVNQGGLWLLPFSGTPKQITTSGFWQAVSAGAAYGTATSAVPQGVANTIIRLDLATGIIGDWFTRQGAGSTVLGIDGQGNPLISVNYFVAGGNEVWIANGTTADPIFGSFGGQDPQGRPIADGHGLWFPISNRQGSFFSQGVALYIAGSGLYWMTSYGVQLAGGCS